MTRSQAHEGLDLWLDMHPTATAVMLVAVPEGTKPEQIEDLAHALEAVFATSDLVIPHLAPMWLAQDQA